MPTEPEDPIPQRESPGQDQPDTKSPQELQPGSGEPVDEMTDQDIDIAGTEADETSARG